MPLLKSFAEIKAFQSQRFSYHCQILALLLLGNFIILTPDGITNFDIALAEHCNIAFCSFVL